MNYGLLVQWQDENTGEDCWHICRGYGPRDASKVYAMWAERQTPYVLNTHSILTLGVECQ